MATIKYKPTTPARRNMTVADYAEITKFSPEKSLVVIKKKNAGRNSYGRITVRHKGGGNKQKSCIFKRFIRTIVRYAHFHRHVGNSLADHHCHNVIHRLQNHISINFGFYKLQFR